VILKFNNLNYLVSWEGDRWVARCPSYHKYHWPIIEYLNRYSKTCEIVGNEFENPELLKQTNS
jgi:hypothetical protein